MPRIADAFIAELEHEAATTRRVLERIPDDKLDWTPHEKSMNLAKLGQHIATTPGGVAGILKEDTFDMGDMTGADPAKSKADILAAHDADVKTAREILDTFDDERLMAMWKVTKDGKEMMSMPRIAAVRNIMLNHWYHHRGQLTVYLRMLNVPLPSVYGPSADENPWADA